MATLLAPLLVAVVGAFVYAVSGNARVAELGRLAFFVGLFWLVYLMGGRAVHLL